MKNETYSDYLSNLIQTRYIVVCWDTVYPVFVDGSLLHCQNLKEAVENFKTTEFDSKCLFILERLGCLAVCIFDGKKLTFCMTDIKMYKRRLADWEFRYSEYEKWVKRKSLRK